ncbi:MAG: DUF2207 domain-containing protein [Bacilli bacterium]|nr:DUF2207 domain-containing protein [Bacilli bacterium]
MRFFIVLVFLIFPFFLTDLVLIQTFNALNIFWFIFSTFMFIYIYINKDKEYESGFKDKYYKDIPSDKTPELLGYLLTGEAKERFFIASVFELIRKNVIKIAKSNKDYILVYNLKHRESLSKGEYYIIKWLFHLLGNDYEVPLSKIKEESKRNSGFFSFCFHEWANIIEVDAAQQNIFENKGSIFMDSLVYFLISYVLAIYNAILTNNYILAILIGIGTSIFIIYTNSFKKRTKESNLEYEKWEAFKRYLKSSECTLNDMDSKEFLKIFVYSKVLKIEKNFKSIMKRSRERDDDQLFVAINLGIIDELDRAISRGIKYSEMATNIFFSKNKGVTQILRKRYNDNITFIYNKD